MGLKSCMKNFCMIIILLNFLCLWIMGIILSDNNYYIKSLPTGSCVVNDTLININIQSNPSRVTIYDVQLYKSNNDYLGNITLHYPNYPERLRLLSLKYIKDWVIALVNHTISCKYNYATKSAWINPTTEDTILANAFYYSGMTSTYFVCLIIYYTYIYSYIKANINIKTRIKTQYYIVLIGSILSLLFGILIITEHNRIIRLPIKRCFIHNMYKSDYHLNVSLNDVEIILSDTHGIINNIPVGSGPEYIITDTVTMTYPYHFILQASKNDIQSWFSNIIDDSDQYGIACHYNSHYKTAWANVKYSKDKDPNNLKSIGIVVLICSAFLIILYLLIAFRLYIYCNS